MNTELSVESNLPWKTRDDGNEYVNTFFGAYEIYEDHKNECFCIRKLWGGDYLCLNPEKESRLTVQHHKSVESAKQCMGKAYYVIRESIRLI